ncbi:MAG: 2-dehydropantoate 2-reductase [Alphaproteobacteria bacterium]|nr:MAG: 2-dehydropantoate 2-reductase [Alphaproteobacteria bacterium]
MKFAVVGVGGVGGYFGARLAADGNDVAFIARGAHRDALRRDGLRVLSAGGDLHIADPFVPDDAGAAGLCDFVLLCVKLWDVAAAIEQIRPLIAHDTAVVPFQNGVVVTDTLSAALGPRHVMGGVAQISAVIERPGVIRHTGTMARLVFGERDGAQTWRQECLLSACIGAGIDAAVSPHIDVDIWEKFVFLAPLAGATAYYRAPVGAILADPERRARLEAMVHETAAVGRAKGIALSADVEARTMAFIAGLPADMKSSMLNDLEGGRRLELQWLNGEVVRLGRDLGVATPENAAVTVALRPYAAGRA